MVFRYFCALILLFFVEGCPVGWGQLNLLKKKANTAVAQHTPPAGSYRLQDPVYRNLAELKNGYPDEPAAWIVYSDRADNITYHNPGRESQPLTTLDFMQACFVIDAKDGYLELVEYQPGLNLRKRRKVLAGPKYLGWVHEDALLLWNRALKDKRSNDFLKALTAYGSERVFSILPQHVEGDSIRIFADPFLDRQLASGTMGSLFYLYKESADGHEYLIGKNPEFVPEQAADAGLGWMSKGLLRIWGTTGFIRLDPASEGRIPFYPLAGNTEPDKRPGEPMTVITAPATKSKDVLDHIFPILRYRTTAEGRVLIRTGLLTEALDKRRNSILNLNGKMLSHQAIEAFGANRSALNILFVVAGGRKDKQYINNVCGVLEAETWKQGVSKYFRSLKLGAVVYRGYGTGCQPARAPLTSDPQEIVSFLSGQARQHPEACGNGGYDQAVFGGLAAATAMLRPHRHESNIIVLYGSGTDRSGSIGPAIAGLSATNSRLLVFQTHHVPHERAYVEFVGMAKDLVSKSARNIIELKKRYMVSDTYPNVVPDRLEYTRGTDTTGRIMFLDYPGRALSQGYILFPNSGENMPIHYLGAFLDSLIGSVGADNRRIDKALRASLARSGTADTRVKPAFASYFPDFAGESLPESFLKANTLRNQKFLLPARVRLRGSNRRAAAAGLLSGVLLTRNELTAFIRHLAALGGSGDFRDKDAVVKQIVRAIEARESQVSLSRPPRELTFTEAMGLITGYFPMDTGWLATTLEQYRSRSSIPLSLGTRFLAACRDKADWLRDQYNNPDLHYFNNGNTYYLIQQPDLPGRPAATESDRVPGPETEWERKPVRGSGPQSATSPIVPIRRQAREATDPLVGGRRHSPAKPPDFSGDLRKVSRQQPGLMGDKGLREKEAIRPHPVLKKAGAAPSGMAGVRERLQGLQGSPAGKRPLSPPEAASPEPLPDIRSVRRALERTSGEDVDTVLGPEAEMKNKTGKQKRQRRKDDGSERRFGKGN